MFKTDHNNIAMLSEIMYGCIIFPKNRLIVQMKKHGKIQLLCRSTPHDFPFFSIRLLVVSTSLNPRLWANTASESVIRLLSVKSKMK